MTTTIITLDDVAAVVGAAVCAELGLRYRRSPGAAALADAIEHDDHHLDAAIDILAWATAAHFESLFGWRMAA